MPLLPQQELKILNLHSGIFSEYIDVKYRFGDNEVIRWQFPNRWGASLITTHHKFKDAYNQYDENDDEDTIEVEEVYTEIVPLSYHTNKEGAVYYNTALWFPKKNIEIPDLIIVLSKIFGMNMSIDISERKWDYDE